MTKNEVIQIRVSPERKAEWRKMATEAGLSLTAWIEARIVGQDIPMQVPRQASTAELIQFTDMTPKTVKLPRVELADEEEYDRRGQGTSPNGPATPDGHNQLKCSCLKCKKYQDWLYGR